MRILFFGTGKSAYDAWQQIEADSQMFTDEYVAFADNNKSLWGKEFCGKEIISPADIHTCEWDRIVIVSTKYDDDIRKQLIEDLGIQGQCVYNWPEYMRLCYSDNIYRNRYKDMDIAGNRSLSSKPEKIVVYTAITGNYDSLKAPLSVTDNITYVCITNNPDIRSSIWNVKYIEDSRMDNVHLARHIKMNPHVYFPDYEMSIWVDAKYQIMDNLELYVSQYQKQSGMLCFPHPERKCICDELAMCILYTAGNNRDMIVQAADYLKEGFPVNYGLYDTGCIVRLHNRSEIKDLMSRWEKEIEKYAIRDQLSFPYVCWKSGFLPDVCNLDINRNQWLMQKRNLYV